MRILRAVAAAVTVVALAAGCGSADAGDRDGAGPTGLGDLAGRGFVSVGVVDAAQRPLDPGTTVHLGFGTDGVVSGSAGCNTLYARAAVVDGRLVTRGPVAGTEIGCPGRQHHDAWLGELLEARPRVELDGDRLTLTSGGTRVTLLDEESADPDRQLVGTLWTLDAIERGTGPDATAGSVPAGVTSTLRFGDDGLMSVRPGCNSGSADHRVDGDVVVVGEMMLTSMACSDTAMQVESTVTDVLQGRVAWAVDGTRLRLTRGARTLVYRAD